MRYNVGMVIVLLFFLGEVFGSFLNVMIMRTVVGEDWVKGRSRCDHCHKEIAWYDNIPLLSYILLRGKCRKCKKVISLQHPVVEGMIGVLFVWWYMVGVSFFRLVQSPLSYIQPGYWLLMGFIFMGTFFADLYYGIIPDIFVWLGIISTLLYRGFLVSSGAMMRGDFYLSILSGMGAWLFFLFLHKITKGRGMGYGDVKFAIVIGLVLGWPRVVTGVFLSFILGAVVGVGLIVLRLRKMKDTLPFGPFMVLGAYVTLLWGEKLLQLLGY